LPADLLLDCRHASCHAAGYAFFFHAIALSFDAMLSCAAMSAMRAMLAI